MARVEVKRVAPRIRCEVHRCNNRAEYSIGSPGAYPTHFLICKECLIAMSDKMAPVASALKEAKAISRNAAKIKAKETVSLSIEKESAIMTCPYCQKTFGEKKLYDAHVALCKDIHEAELDDKPVAKKK